MIEGCCIDGGRTRAAVAAAASIEETMRVVTATAAVAVAETVAVTAAVAEAVVEEAVAAGAAAIAKR